MSAPCAPNHWRIAAVKQPAISSLSESDDSLRITAARSHLLRVPVRPLQVDSQSVLEAWDVLAVELVAASGLSGWGYQCGFGAAMSALNHFIDGAILPELIGREAGRHREWWSEFYLQRHHTGLNGPAIQGVSAPEVAAWDLMARAAEKPLWALLGDRCLIAAAPISIPPKSHATTFASQRQWLAAVFYRPQPSSSGPVLFDF